MTNYEAMGIALLALLSGCSLLNSPADISSSVGGGLGSSSEGGNGAGGSDRLASVGGDRAIGGSSDGGSSGEGGASEQVGGSSVAGGGSESGPQSGKIKVKVTGVTGSTDLMLVAISSPDASFCKKIDADPFSMQGDLLVFQGNPCEPTSEVKIFTAGSHQVDLGITVPGETSPKMCVQLSVNVDGDSTAFAPPFDEWKTDCTK